LTGQARTCADAAFFTQIAVSPFHGKPAGRRLQGRRSAGSTASLPNPQTDQKVDGNESGEGFNNSGAAWMDTHGERGQLAIGSERVKSRSARGPEAPERGTLDVRLKPGAVPVDGNKLKPVSSPAPAKTTRLCTASAQ